jgi:glycosyltransferase involved in cell wall biosynthesis
MHIAILGTRGIPARYGGFETFAEELGKRLAARGHRVTVYGRERHTSDSHLGCELVYLPTIRHKYLDTVTHTFLSALHLLFRRADVALFCNAANAVFTWMPRLTGIPVALNVDGLERNRRKWNRLGRLWYLWSERWSTWFPNRVVSDAEQIRRYYLDRYGADSDFIPYGADMEKPETRAALDQLGLEPMRYFLYVSRMEPENNALLVRESFERVEGDVKLALIGDAPYAQDYIARVRNTRDPRIVMPGAVYGLGYRELGSHCLAYIHATEVGGTHPALIENMGRGALTLYLDTPENAEAAGGAGIPFTPETLADRMREVLAMSEDERNRWRERARQRIAGRYSWEAVTDAYESLFRRLAR